MLLPVHESCESFGEQATCHGQIADLCDLVVEEEQEGSRLWPNYYLVAFFGAAFDRVELGGARFVYREPGAVRIADFSNVLKEQFGKLLKRDDVVVVNTKTVDTNKFDLAAKAYIQVTGIGGFCLLGGC